MADIEIVFWHKSASNSQLPTCFDIYLFLPEVPETPKMISNTFIISVQQLNVYIINIHEYFS